MQTRNSVARTERLVIKNLANETLIYDLENNTAYCLNETAAMVWNLCDGNNSVADISQKLSLKLKQPVTDDLVWLSLDQLKKDNLLTDSQDLKIDFSGLSRREVIRKVGLASLVTLPVIASLVAPTAASAASSTALLGSGQFAGNSSEITTNPRVNCTSLNFASKNSTCTTLYGAKCQSGSAKAGAPCTDTAPLAYTYACYCT